MDISPQRVRSAEFSTVKRGLDPDEVRAFLDEVANELERAQNQSTAMEARARAAVARLQEISESTPAEAAPAEPAAQAPAPADITPSVDQAETISRTLLLAQRTADNAIAEAQAEAARLRAEAEAEATRAIESSREMTQRMIDEARDEARRSGEAERVQVEGEVNALLARRDFLESDVDHLQTFLVEERNRLRDAATSILEIADRVPAGLGEVRRPLLSAADDDPEATADEAGADAVDDADHAGDSDHTEGPDDTTSVEPRLPGDTATADDDTPAGDERPAADTIDGTPADDDESETTLRLGRVDASAPRPDDGDQLVIQTDIADEGPTGFSYDDRSR